MRTRFVLAALAILAPAASLPAQGIIVPDRCRETCGVPLPNALPVESVTLDVKIDGQVATTHVTQVFRNETGATLEGTYFFPIPASASVTEFAIWDGGRRLAGEVRPREEARRIYDSIVRRRRDPGLLEYAGENLFQASIFPINPRSTKKLEITYTEVLSAQNGSVGYRYPLGIGRNAAPVERLSGRVEVRAPSALRTLYSPSHSVDVRREDGGRRATATWESARGAERRDFQLFYGLADRDVGLSLFTYREPGKDGYFLLLLSPREDVARREYAAKDVVYVLDTSGSMQDDDKMEKARRALLFGVRALRPQDRFNIVSFAGETRRMETGLIAADRAGRDRGVAFVEGLRAVGGTNINDAMTEALAQLPRERGTRTRLVVFLTDGLPTVGETAAERIVENVRRARADGVRVFTFGVGYDVNTMLLDRVAAENGGTAEYVEPREDLEVKVSSFFDKVNHPVLTNLALDMGGVQTELVYPRALPDLFRGTQLALVGRYRNERDLQGVTLRLSGNASPTHTFAYNGLRFPLRAEEHDFLPRLWATRRVGWLMEQIRTRGESRELRDEVVELGTRHGIVTPYTSFLALEPGEREQPPVVRGMQTLQPPAVQPEDFSGQGRAGGVARGVDAGVPQAPPPPPPPPSAPPPPPAPEVMVVTGADAVRQSRTARAQQDALTLEGTVVPASVRSVGGKTFYLRSGVWADSELKAGLPETSLRFGSDEYFDLLRRVPALARFFSLGERVAVVWEGRVYRTAP
jgi:Ca-activated chloride channel family protein